MQKDYEENNEAWEKLGKDLQASCPGSRMERHTDSVIQLFSPPGPDKLLPQSIVRTAKNLAKEAGIKVNIKADPYEIVVTRSYRKR